MIGHHRKSEKGQTTVELLASASLLMTAVTGMGYLFKAEWDRGKCTYLVFEKTHAVSIGSPSPSLFSLSRSQVQTQELPDSFRGVSLCRGSPEMITIPKLETDQ